MFKNTPLDAEELASVLQPIMNPQFAPFDHATVSRTDEGVVLKGDAPLFGVAEASFDITFTERYDDLAVRIEARFLDDRSLHLPGIEHLGILAPALSIHIAGLNDLTVSAMVCAVKGTIQMRRLYLPIRLRMPLGDADWVLELDAEMISLPRLQDVAALFGESGLLGAIPESFTVLDELAISAFTVHLNLQERTISSIEATVTVGQDWLLIEPNLKLSMARLFVQLIAPTLPGERSLHTYVQGVVEGASIAIPCRMQLGSEIGAQLTLDANTPIPLSGLVDLVELIGIGDVLDGLPDGLRDVGGLALRGLEIHLSTSPLSLNYVAFTVHSDEEWAFIPGGLSLAYPDLTLAVADPFNASSRFVSGRIGGLFSVGDYLIDVLGTVEEEFQLTGAISEFNLRDLVAALPGEPAVAFPDIVVQNLVMSIASDGQMHLRAGTDIDFSGLVQALSIPLPDAFATLSLPVIELSVDTRNKAYALTIASDTHVAFPPGSDSKVAVTYAGMQVEKSGDAPAITRFEVHLHGGTSIADGFAVDIQNLRCQLQLGETAWQTSGHVEAELFGQSYTLEAAIQVDGTSHRFALIYPKTLPLVDWEGVGRAVLSDITLFSEKQSASGTATYAWAVASSASVAIDHLFSTDGRLAIEKSSEGNRLKLELTSPEIKPITLPMGIQKRPEIHLKLDGLTLERARKGAKEASWFFSSSARLRLKHMPEVVDGYFPIDEIEGAFYADETRSSLSFALTPPIAPDFPELALSFSDGARLSLGTPELEIREIELRIGEEMLLSAALHVSPPHEFNYVFGKDESGKPAMEFLNASFDLQLTLSRALRLVVLSSPFKPLRLRLDEETGKTWSDWDIENFAQFSLQTPEFSYQQGGWQASGGFEGLDEIKITLAPIKFLLDRAGLGVASAALPDAIPLRGLDLRSPDVFADIERLLGVTLGDGKGVHIFKEASEAIQKGLDAMPERLRTYLDLTIPESFFFDIEVRTTGGTSISISTEDDEPLNMLLPLLSPMPQLVGFSIYKLSLGQMLGGSLLSIEVDGYIDRFDLPTLIAAPLMKEAGQDLTERYILRDTLAIAPTAVPMPIPFFFGELGLDLQAFTGIAMQAHWKYPKPTPSIFGFVDLFSQVFSFFTEKEFLLHEQAPPDGLALSLTIGENYIGLPEFLGGGQLGLTSEVVEGLSHGTQSDFSIDVYDNMARFLDFLKTGNAGYLIEAIPLKQTVGSHTTWIRVGSKDIEFGPIQLNAAWCITTENEFRDVILADPEAMTIVSEASADGVLKAIPKVPEQTGFDKGFVILLMGGWEIPNLTVFQVQFGMMLTETSGFETGIRIFGGIERFLSLEIQGNVTINPIDHIYAIRGHIELDLFETSIISLDGEMSVTRDRFLLAFDLAFGGTSVLAPMLIIGKLPSGRTGLGIQVNWFDGASVYTFEASAGDGTFMLSTGMSLTIPKVLDLRGEGRLSFSPIPGFRIEGTAEIANGWLRGHALLRFEDGEFELRIGGGVGDAGCTLYARANVSSFYEASFVVGIEFELGFINEILAATQHLISSEIDAASNHVAQLRADFEAKKESLDQITIEWKDFHEHFVKGCNTALSVMQKSYDRRPMVERILASKRFTEAKQSVEQARDDMQANWEDMQWSDLRASLQGMLSDTLVSIEVPAPTFLKPFRKRTIHLDFLGQSRKQFEGYQHRIKDFEGDIDFRIKASTLAEEAIRVAERVVDQVASVGEISVSGVQIESEISTLNGVSARACVEMTVAGKQEQIEVTFSTNPKEMARALFEAVV